MKKSKRYASVVEKFDKKKAYTASEAVKLVKEASNAKFDETVEVAMNMNLDTRKADQQLRGAVVLPNGTGKSQTVLVLAKGDQAKAAKGETVATISKEQLKEVAETKLPDLNAYEVDAAMKIVEGTARNMGLKVEE